jgi:hypothetical protein
MGWTTGPCLHTCVARVCVGLYVSICMHVRASFFLLTYACVCVHRRWTLRWCACMRSAVRLACPPLWPIRLRLLLLQTLRLLCAR